MSTDTRNQILTFIGGIVVLALVAGCLWYLWPSADGTPNNGALVLSRVTVVSLAIVVALMAGLAAIYRVLDLTSATQPLGLPEGSVRALISFSLLLIFVCMSSYLYTNLSSPDLSPSGVQLKGLSQVQIDDLKSHFIVVYQPSRSGNPKYDLAADGVTQLFDATYYLKRGTSGDDFAKQLFTTLATVFVSVVSFYFGSSTTTSAIAAANTARQGDGSREAGGQPPAGGGGRSGTAAGQSPSTATNGRSGAGGKQQEGGAFSDLGASGGGGQSVAVVGRPAGTTAGGQSRAGTGEGQSGAV